jgi:signal transduction histidine kinase
MDWTAWLGWIVAAVLAVALVVATRRGGSSAAPVAEPPSREVAPPARASLPEPPSSLSEEEALRRTLTYLNRTVVQDLQDLERALSSAGGVPDALERALHALGDLGFYADAPGDEPVTREHLANLVQEAVREYTIETRIPVRVHAPAEPLYVQVRREALKDSVFLLLANAGQYSGGKPVDVFLEGAGPSGFRIRIVDAGPGFTDEGLERATEPFWSTDPRGVGLGLPQARARVAEMKGRLSLRNQEGGGAEVTLEFPERDAGPAA